MLAALKVVWHFLSIQIPLPLWLIVAVCLGWNAMAYWDKTAAIKHAVEQRVTELVTGAEKAALEEQVKAANKRATDLLSIIEETRRRSLVVLRANEMLEDQINKEEEDDAIRQAELDALKATPIDECVATPPFLGRLRNNR